MVELIKIYNEIMEEFKNYNLELIEKKFSLTDPTIFAIYDDIPDASENFDQVVYALYKPIKEIMKEKENQYKDIHNEYNDDEEDEDEYDEDDENDEYDDDEEDEDEYDKDDLNYLIEELEDHGYTVEELDYVFTTRYNKLIDNDRDIAYNLLTDINEYMRHESNLYIDLNNFVQKLSTIDYSDSDIIVNYIELYYKTVYDYEIVDGVTFLDILNETNFLTDIYKSDYINLLNNFTNIIKNVFNIDNIYVYDYTKDNKICILELNMKFKNSKNLELNKLYDSIINILAKYIPHNKNKYLFKYYIPSYDLLDINFTFILDFKDYVDLTKLAILYNFINKL